MQVNWSVRFKNKVWLTTFITFIVSTVYNLLAAFDVAPAVTQDSVLQVVSAVLQVLSMLGVIIDPTTKGVSDSDRAMTYTKPT